MRRWFSSVGAALPLALFAGLLAPTLTPAETCMSPFVKRLDRPEKYLYVFCVDADARDNDFLAVIDVDAEGRGTVAVAQYNVKATGHVAKLKRDLKV